MMLVLGYRIFQLGQPLHTRTLELMARNIWNVTPVGYTAGACHDRDAGPLVLPDGRPVHRYDRTAMKSCIARLATHECEWYKSSFDGSKKIK